MLQPSKKTFPPNFCITKVFLIDNCCFNLFRIILLDLIQVKITGKGSYILFIIAVQFFGFIWHVHGKRESLGTNIQMLANSPIKQKCHLSLLCQLIVSWIMTSSTILLLLILILLVFLVFFFFRQGLSYGPPIFTFTNYHACCMSVTDIHQCLILSRSR